MDTIQLPRRSQVVGVRLAVSAESILDDRYPDEDERDRRARRAAHDYAERIADVVGWEHVDVTEEPEPSDYDSGWMAYHVTYYGDVSVDEWLRIAEGYCLDGMDEDEVLPEWVDVVPTLGILGADGITPAVAVQGTDEGWGVGGHEPMLVASFYVAFAVRDEDGGGR